MDGRDDIYLSEEDAEKFFDSLERPPLPNEKLMAAFRAHKARLGVYMPAEADKLDGEFATQEDIF